MVLKSKDILGLRDMSAEEIEYILNTAKTMKYIIESKNKKTPHLQGKSIITLFYENSTRTRLSFELGIKIYEWMCCKYILLQVAVLQKVKP